MGFNQFIGGLTTSETGYNRGLVKVKEGMYHATKQPLVAVTMKLMGKSPSLIMEDKKCIPDIALLKWC